MKHLHRLFAVAAATFFIASHALAQNPGTVTNHAFALGKGAGTTGYTSLLCGAGQIAVGTAADPVCTAVSGDATLSGAGLLTLATVNSNVGAFGGANSIPSFTVDGKGRVTAAAANVPAIPFTELVGSLACGQLPALTGDVTTTGCAATLATVNGNAGTFGSATLCVTATFNAKGLVTAVSAATCTPAIGSISGLGTAVATALGVSVGSAGAFVVSGGALGTPSSATLTNATGLPTTGLTGTLQAAQEPAHTGDVTNAAGSLATTVIAINGVNQTAAWSTWSPTFTTTSVGGTPITAAVSGTGARFRQIGKTVYFTLDFTISNIGAGNTGGVTFTLPITAFNASYVMVATGKEVINTAKLLGIASFSTTTGSIVFYDNTSAITVGNRFNLGGFYETQ